MEIMSRVHGTEMEWGIQIPQSDQVGCTDSRPLSAGEFNTYSKAYLSDKPHIGSLNNCFVENGGRFYSDVGEKRETTTPEDTSYMSTTASEIANEQMMFDILSGTAKDAEGKDMRLSKFALNKRVVDDRGHTWGYHESYNVPSDIMINAEGLAVLGIHLATRNIFAGAGFLDAKGKFWMGQKASDVEDDYSSASTRIKPVVNLRLEHHSNDKTKRVHVISGDPSMSPWATRMQLGTTSLVLEMIAEGLDAEEFAFEPSSQPLGLAKFTKKLAHDSKASTDSFALALEMQQKLVKSAMYLDLSPEQEWIVGEWDRVCFDLQNNPLTAGDHVEWLLRRRMLERYQENSGLAWNSEQMRSRDRQCDRIGPDSIGLKLRETAWSQWMPAQSLIDERKTASPTTTRAAIRSKFIKAFHLQNHLSSNVVSADWSSVKYIRRINIADPYSTKSNAVDKLIASHYREAA